MRLLVITHATPIDSIGGRNVRVVRIAGELSKRHDIDLLTLDSRRFADRRVESTFRQVFRFGRSCLDMPMDLARVLAGSSLTERFRSGDAERWLSIHGNTYDALIPYYIHSALSVPPSLYRKTYVDLVDAMALHYKEATHAPIWRKAIFHLERRRVARLEVGIANRARHSFITSETERAFLVTNGVAEESITVVHNGVDLPPQKHNARDIMGRELVIGFIGKLDYYPNEEACEYLVREILPRVRRQMPARCVLVGAAPSRRVSRLQAEGVVITGFVDDLWSALSQVDIVVLPMLVASGIQNKLLCALSYGIPTVCSRRALIASEFQGDRVVIGASETEEYVSNTIRLARSRELRTELSERSRLCMETSFSWPRAAEQVERSISAWST